MEKLALLGGPAAVTLDQAAFRRPLVSEEAIAVAVGMLRRGEISQSPLVGEFEKRFAAYIGVEHGLAVTSGTVALQEALFAVGVGPGDEVIVPSFTFIFSAAPIVAAHATPVFCDVDLDTHCLDPEDVRGKITPRTKAIMVVHVWGNPADMDALTAIAREKNLAIIEDCAHAHGAAWKGRRVGSIGDVGCFSFQGSKTLAGGEAGILVTGRRECWERAVALGHYERVAGLPADSPWRKYTTSLGFKHRVHPLAIALVDTELKCLDEKNALRSENALYLERGLADLACVIPQKSYPGGVRQHSYHYARYDGTELGGVALDTFLRALKAEGVAVGTIGYGYLHEAPLFRERTPYGKGCPGRCPHARDPFDGTVPDLPATVRLRETAFMMAPRFEVPCRELLDQYLAAYRKVAARADDLAAHEAESGAPGGRKGAPDNWRSVNLV